MGSLRARSPSHCHTGASLCSLLTVETLTRLWLPIQDGGLWLLPPPPWPETAGAELRLLTPLTVSHRVSLPHRSLGSPWTWWTQGTCSDIYWGSQTDNVMSVVTSVLSLSSPSHSQLSSGRASTPGGAGGWRFNVQIIITDWTGSSWRSHTSWRGQSLNVLHLRHTGPDLLLAVGYPAPHLSLSLSLIDFVGSTRARPGCSHQSSH